MKTLSTLTGLFLVTLRLLSSFSLAYEFDNSVYDVLLRYAYLSKVAYCIDSLHEGHDLSRPIVLKPKPFAFLQSGYDDTDYYAFSDEEEIELHVAKILYKSAPYQSDAHQNIDELDDKSRSAGFFALDHSNNGTIILAFRGSSGRRDFLADINVSTSDYEPYSEDAKAAYNGCQNCKVHKGFYQRYKELADDLFPSLEKLTDTFPDYKLVITGHSLGGALAILTGIELALMQYKPLVVSFGSPKVSNAALASYMDKLFDTPYLNSDQLMGDELSEGCIRVVHKGDYVPLLPPGNNKFVQSGVEFLIEKVDLPHPKSSVVFEGPAKDLSHSLEFKFGDLLAFDLHKAFHFQEHNEYFYRITQCEDIEQVGGPETTEWHYYEDEEFD